MANDDTRPGKAQSPLIILISNLISTNNRRQCGLCAYRALNQDNHSGLCHAARSLKLPIVSIHAALTAAIGVLTA